MCLILLYVLLINIKIVLWLRCVVVVSVKVVTFQVSWQDVNASPIPDRAVRSRGGFQSSL